MNGIPWTPAEDAVLRERYGRDDPFVIAIDLRRDLRRSLRQVYCRAARLGLSKHVPRVTKERLAEIRRRSKAGQTDEEIAAALGFSRSEISRKRREMGLPVSSGVLRRQRDAVKAQLQVLGLSSPTQLRTRAFTRFAIENGWPADLRPREVQVLNVLADRGVPMTRVELAAAIGMRSDVREYANGQKELLRGNGQGGTYTASLARRGLVTILERLGPPCKARGKGCGRRVSLYTLGPVALAILEERAKQCRTES